MAGQVQKTPLVIQSPATIKVGNLGTTLNEIIAGTVTINLPSIAANGVASASAAANGLSTAFAVIVQPRAWVASEPVWIAGATCIAGGIQVTGYNASGSAVDPTSQSCNFWAAR